MKIVPVILAGCLHCFLVFNCDDCTYSESDAEPATGSDDDNDDGDSDTDGEDIMDSS